MRYPTDYKYATQRFGDNPTGNIKPGDEDYWIIEQFGDYQHDGHTGMDFAVPIGTPIRACAEGTVIHVGYYGGTYADNDMWISPGFAGWCYVVDHPWGRSIYGHGKEKASSVSVGDHVAEGQTLGLSGNTGGSTGPHIHFELLLDGWVVNSKFYGRVDPEPIVNGSLGFAGEITQENELTPEQTDFMFTLLKSLVENVATKKDLIDQAVRTPVEVWSYKNPGIGGGDAFQILRDAVANTDRIADALAEAAANAAAGGASVEQIKEAVKQAFREGTE